MSFIEIEIKNWEKFNARKDIKRPWWFKLANNILEDADIYDLNDAEFRSWIYILSQASKQQSSIVRIIINHATRVCGLNLKSLKSCIAKLSLKQILIEIRTPPVRDPAMIRTQSVQQTRLEEIRREENILLDFDLIYKKYPRKEGKGPGMQLAKKEISTMEDFDLLNTAVERYRDHCQKMSTEAKFIKHFGTFMRSWRDWLDPETGTGRNFKNSRAMLTEEDFA